MIRISINRQTAPIIMNVEGMIAGPWADELERCWLREMDGNGVAAVAVNLSSVTFIDDRGREVLKEMINRGVTLKSTGVMTQGVIEEIMGER